MLRETFAVYRKPATLFAVLVAGLGSACPTDPPLNPLGDLTVDQSNEVTATFVSPFTTQGPDGHQVAARALYMYNNFKWAWTDDEGASFHLCDATNNCPVPMAPNQSAWLGDPVVAAAPRRAVNSTSPPSAGGIVAASMLGSSGPSKQDMVLLSWSTDGGATFRQTVQVNGGADTGNFNCNNGKVDQPHFAFDASDPSAAFYIVWRYRSNGGLMYGACIRAGYFDTTTSPPQLIWINSSYEIQNLNREPFWGVGGLMVSPYALGPNGDGVSEPHGVTVVYSYTDNFHTDCPATADMQWYSVTTNNYGASWSNSNQIYDATSFVPCTPANKYVRVNRGTFGVARDENSGTLQVVVNDTQNTALAFNSSDEGSSWSPHNPHIIYHPTGLYQPVVSTDFGGAVAVFFYGVDDRFLAGGTPLTGAMMTPYITADRNVNQPPPNPPATVWSFPQPVGNSFAAVTLKPCNSDSDCPAVFAGNNGPHCIAGGCVAQRLGGAGGDYQGMAAIPAGFVDGATNRFNPAWTTENDEIHTSFVELTQ